MRRKWLVLVLGVVLAFSLVCGGLSYSLFHLRSVDVPDVSQEAVLPISARPTDGLGFLVSGVWIRVEGEIDGEAEVWISYNQHHQISGRVDFRVYHDWFDRTCKIHYRPCGVASGKLRVYYHFD